MKWMRIMMMYMPLICLGCLIMFVYVTYVVNYLGMYVDRIGSIMNGKDIRKRIEGVVYAKFVIEEIFNEKFITIYYGIFIVITWNLFWGLFSLMKAAFINPGYLLDPIEMEFKFLVNNNNNNDNINNNTKSISLNAFYIQCQNGPLTKTESDIMLYKLSKHINNSSLSLLYESTNNTSISNSENISNNNSYFTLCPYCLRWKPNRCHHCRKCNKCVLKMDHHCPWIVNCVGYNNYKYFILSILYGSIATLLISLTYIEFIISINICPSLSISYCVWNTFTFICNFLLMCFSLYLLCIHMKRVIYNMTSIENAELVKMQYDNNSSLQMKSQYNKGVLSNIIDVFGTNPFLWFFPVNTFAKENECYFKI